MEDNQPKNPPTGASAGGNIGNRFMSQPMPEPPDNFRTHHLLPKIADLFDQDGISGSGKVFLRPNLTRSRYRDLNQYLDIHYRLLREDFLDPLRQTIGKFCAAAALNEQQVPNADQQKSIHFYGNVSIVQNSFLWSESVPDRPDYWRRYYIHFDAQVGAKWKTNKQLIFGSLVALWNAKENLILLAVVTRSEPAELEKGWLTLSFDTEPPAGFENLSYTMLECPIFYEPYRVVMEAYQQMNLSTFPLAPFILGWTKSAGTPNYIQTDNNRPLQYRITMRDGSVHTIPDVRSINCWPPAEDIGVNAVQRLALHAAATRKVALIQGPPGTGKSFIGRKIVINLLENRQLWQGDNNNNEHLKTLMQPGEMKRFWESHGRRWNDTRCPIVIICMTNQALDQFLESLLDTTVRVIRIGSQSKSTLLEGFLMSNTKENVYNHHKSYTETNFFFYSSKMKALGRVIEDLEDKIAFLTTKLSLQEVDDVVATRLELDRMESNYKHYITEFNFLKAKTEETLCRNVDVIGMTTTGAASRRQLVNLLRPKIVVVEEAAQVLEPHIVASLTSGCQHLIMIGDHQQLRPSCNVHLLSTKFRMDVSLFERLIGLGLPVVTLQVQHRMRDDVARLIVPSVYRQLLNHPSTDQYPPIPSMGGRNVFFLDHRGKEEREVGGSSYFNPFEAKFALHLSLFLFDQGILQEKITILVAYAAQKRFVEELRREKFRCLDAIHITTIDNYQGEENDVIILSLVRNNDDGSAGFLRTPNRVCVALSRARHGLYLLGNMALLAQSGSPLWRHVQTVLEQKDQLGDHLTLSCDRHPEHTFKVKEPNDFPLAGVVCKERCSGSLVICGHDCPLPCRNRCQHLITICKMSVMKKLDCGHTMELFCRSPMTPRCNSAKCELLLPGCLHPCPSKCSDPCERKLCEVIVDLPDSPPLPCSHPVRGPCKFLLQPPWRRPSSKMDKSPCPARCSTILSCGHRCSSKCGECASLGVHGVCRSPCNRKLVCNHDCQSLCFQACRPCKKPCELRCAHRTCSNLCGLPCSPCPAANGGCAWSCPHLKCDPHPCEELCARKPCELPCTKLLDCQHRCPGFCGEICPPSSVCPACQWLKAPSSFSVTLCKRMVLLPDCGHSVSVVEMDKPEDPEAVLQGPPSCPRCKVPMTATWGRYGDRVKAYHLDVASALSAYDRDWKIVLERSIEKLLVHHAPNVKTAEALRSALRGRGADTHWAIYWRIIRICLTNVFEDHLVGTCKETPYIKPFLSGLRKCCTELGDALILHSERPDEVLLQWRRLQLLRRLYTLKAVVKGPATNALNEAERLLLSKKNWTYDKNRQISTFFKSVSTKVAFNYQEDDVFDSNNLLSIHRRLSLELGLRWSKCPACLSVYLGNSCPNDSCQQPTNY